MCTIPHNTCHLLHAIATVKVDKLVKHKTLQYAQTCMLLNSTASTFSTCQKREREREKTTWENCEVKLVMHRFSNGYREKEK